MPGAEATARAGAHAPARAVLARTGGVEAQPGDHDVGVTGVRVHGDPLAGTRDAPAHEGPRVERALDQAAAVKREAHGAGAVVGAVAEAPMPTAVAVGLAGNPVRRVNRLLDDEWSARRRDRRPPVTREPCHG